MPDLVDRAVRRLAVGRRCERALKEGVPLPDHRLGHTGDPGCGFKGSQQLGRPLLIADQTKSFTASAWEGGIASPPMTRFGVIAREIWPGHKDLEARGFEFLPPRMYSK